MRFFSKKKNYECLDCEENFQKRDELLVHGQTKHNRIILKCTLCNMKFLYLKSIKAHTEYSHHKVSLLWRMLFSWSPLAYLHIQKFWVGLAINLGVFFFSILTLELWGSVLNSANIGETSLLIYYVGLWIPMIFIMWKLATSWNNKINVLLESMSDDELKDDKNETF
ncbi:hypothetical protein [Candidatus Nitrosarchaeum limnium]|jgi:hypothetical protein|uniref:Zinc finger, C2H2 type n=1 Tax=Candidatus Nitrosarchaeum limnium BG20 TaxID=859192 RepID=S2DZB4_9ARCH|nr:hypothetical protein [Candidatus Nitrosarchaeum limnium]EPA04490.1 zinc finger, C2H2 type [Candidatus Nitrosarchaeum limnium BG20]